MSKKENYPSRAKFVQEVLSEANFSETVKSAKEGPLRKEKKPDGWYVVGNGQIIHRPTRSKPVGKLNYKYRKIIGVRRS